MARILSLFLLALLALPAFGQEGWKDGQGQLSPDTESRKSVHGFGGWLVVTSDADWQAKWETTSDTVPHFTEAKHVAKGKKIFVLTLFANPRLDKTGAANVTCDILVLRPDGTTSTQQIDMPCFKGAIHESPSHLFLSGPVIGFTGDPGDPAGSWIVQVLLKDNVRQVFVPLRTSFVLEP